MPSPFPCSPCDSSMSVKENLHRKKKYEHNKNFITNIVNTVIVALAITYYLDKAIVKNYMPKPLNSESKTMIEFAFIKKHYNVIVDKIAFDVPLKSVSNLVANNLKDSCGEPVGSSNDNVDSTEIIDLTSEQVERNN